MVKNVEYCCMQIWFPQNSLDCNSHQHIIKLSWVTLPMTSILIMKLNTSMFVQQECH